jgi:oligopeptide/dipeptide ABC transporter ATP-binding protein
VLFAAPRHHYTAGLLRSVPSYGDGSEVTRRTRLLEIQGIVPSLHELPRGCKFVDRCPAAEPLCHAEEPPLVALGASWVRCHYPIDPPSASPRTRALDPPDPRDPRDPPGRPPGTPPKDPPIDPGAPPGDPPIDPPRAPPEAPLIDPPRSPPSRPPGDPPIDPPIEPPKDPSIDPPLDAPGAPGGPPRKDAT